MLFHFGALCYLCAACLLLLPVIQMCVWSKGLRSVQIGKMQVWLAGDSTFGAMCGEGEEEFQVLGGSLP